MAKLDPHEVRRAQIPRGSRAITFAGQSLSTLEKLQDTRLLARLKAEWALSDGQLQRLINDADVIAVQFFDSHVGDWVGAWSPIWEDKKVQDALIQVHSAFNALAELEDCHLKTVLLEFDGLLGGSSPDPRGSLLVVANRAQAIHAADRRGKKRTGKRRAAMSLDLKRSFPMHIAGIDEPGAICLAENHPKGQA
jgi:hypothetical protein